VVILVRSVLGSPLHLRSCLAQVKPVYGYSTKDTLVSRVVKCHVAVMPEFSGRGLSDVRGS
jgi:hypothetical protein